MKYQHRKDGRPINFNKGNSSFAALAALDTVARYRSEDPRYKQAVAMLREILMVAR